MVTVPLSRAGIIAGLHVGVYSSIGRVCHSAALGWSRKHHDWSRGGDEMFAANNWPRAAALAVVMIVMILVPLAAYYYYSAKQDALHGD